MALRFLANFEPCSHFLSQPSEFVLATVGLAVGLLVSLPVPALENVKSAVLNDTQCLKLFDELSANGKKPSVNGIQTTEPPIFAELHKMDEKALPRVDPREIVYDEGSPWDNDGTTHPMIRTGRLKGEKVLDKACPLMSDLIERYGSLEEVLDRLGGISKTEALDELRNNADELLQDAKWYALLNKQPDSLRPNVITLKGIYRDSKNRLHVVMPFVDGYDAKLPMKWPLEPGKRVKVYPSAIQDILKSLLAFKRLRIFPFDFQPRITKGGRSAIILDVSGLRPDTFDPKGLKGEQRDVWSGEFKNIEENLKFAAELMPED